MEFRVLISDDATAFRAIRLRGLKENQSAFLESYEEALVHPPEHFSGAIARNTIIGCFDDNTLVGITSLARMKGELQRHKGYIGMVYVAPDARGKGVARKLLELAIARAQEMGLELLQLGADVTNPVSVGLYKSLGFEQYGIDRHVTKLPDGRYVDDMLMVKFLKPVDAA